MEPAAIAAAFAQGTGAQVRRLVVRIKVARGTEEIEKGGPRAKTGHQAVKNDLGQK
jgi:hypothetical protein